MSFRDRQLNGNKREKLQQRRRKKLLLKGGKETNEERNHRVLRWRSNKGNIVSTQLLRREAKDPQGGAK